MLSFFSTLASALFMFITIGIAFYSLNDMRYTDYAIISALLSIIFALYAILTNEPEKEKVKKTEKKTLLSDIKNSMKESRMESDDRI